MKYCRDDREPNYSSGECGRYGGGSATRKTCSGGDCGAAGACMICPGADNVIGPSKIPKPIEGVGKTKCGSAGGSKTSCCCWNDATAWGTCCGSMDKARVIQNSNNTVKLRESELINIIKRTINETVLTESKIQINNCIDQCSELNLPNSSCSSVCTSGAILPGTTPDNTRSILCCIFRIESCCPVRAPRNPKREN